MSKAKRKEGGRGTGDGSGRDDAPERKDPGGMGAPVGSMDGRGGRNAEVDTGRESPPTATETYRPIADDPGPPPEPRRRKLGRPSKSEKLERELAERSALEAQQKAEEKRRRAGIEETARELAPVASTIVELPFEIAAARKGSHWTLKPGESEPIAERALIVIQKRFGLDWLKNLQDEIALAALLYAAIRARLDSDIERDRATKSKVVGAIEQDNENPAS